LWAGDTGVSPILPSPARRESMRFTRKYNTALYRRTLRYVSKDITLRTVARELSSEPQTIMAAIDSRETAHTIEVISDCPQIRDERKSNPR